MTWLPLNMCFCKINLKYWFFSTCNKNSPHREAGQFAKWLIYTKLVHQKSVCQMTNLPSVFQVLISPHLFHLFSHRLIIWVWLISIWCVSKFRCLELLTLKTCIFLMLEIWLISLILYATANCSVHFLRMLWIL